MQPPISRNTKAKRRQFLFKQLLGFLIAIIDALFNMFQPRVIVLRTREFVELTASFH